MQSVNPLCIDLAGLTRAERIILRLRDGHHMRVVDIADVTELPPAKVARAIRRARAKYSNCWHRLNFGRAIKEIRKNNQLPSGS